VDDSLDLPDNLPFDSSNQKAEKQSSKVSPRKRRDSTVMCSDEDS
jgi:hypothetical protein